MLGKKVKHKAFGLGIITEFDNSYMTVEFAERTSKFAYPDACEKFLTLENDVEQQNIVNEIEKKKAEEEENRRKKEAERKAEKDRKAMLEAEKRSQIAKKYSYSPKQAVHSQRVEGKRMVFYVFQGNTFNREYQGGYLWAPIENKSSTPPHH